MFWNVTAQSYSQGCENCGVLLSVVSQLTCACACTHLNEFAVLKPLCCCLFFFRPLTYNSCHRPIAVEGRFSHHLFMSASTALASSPSRPKREAAMLASALISAELTAESGREGRASMAPSSGRKRSRSAALSSSHRAASTSASRANSPAALSRASKKRKSHPQQSFPDAYVPGPVFDTCNEVRRKIRAFISKGEMTISAFLRQLGGINSNSYRQFMTMKVSRAIACDPGSAPPLVLYAITWLSDVLTPISHASFLLLSVVLFL